MIMKIVQINEVAGDAMPAAHLLKYDSVHGTWERASLRSLARAKLLIDGQPIAYTQNPNIADTDWSAVDMVVECTGTFKSQEALAPYFDQGCKKGGGLGTGKGRYAKCSDGGQRPPLYQPSHSDRRLLHHQLPGTCGGCPAEKLWH